MTKTGSNPVDAPPRTVQRVRGLKALLLVAVLWVAPAGAQTPVCSSLRPTPQEAEQPETRTPSVDTSVTLAVTPRILLALDVNHVTSEVTTTAMSASLLGLGASARYQFTRFAALGVRYERLDDEGLVGGVDQMLEETTLTAEYKLSEGFLVRGEFRSDWSDERFFPGPSGADDLRRRQSTALLGGVWWFGNKQGIW